MPIIHTTKELRPRDGREFYPTQVELVTAALDYLDIPAPARILDPGSGAGVWGEETRKRWSNAHIMGVDKHFTVGPACYDTWWVTDFLTTDIPWQFDLIVGNPPYRLDWPDRFSRKSYELLKPGGTLLFLLEISFAASQQRTNYFWPDHPAVQELPLGERPSFTGDGKTNEKDYCLYIWQKGYRGDTQKIWGFGYRGAINNPINKTRKYTPPLPAPSLPAVATPVKAITKRGASPLIPGPNDKHHNGIYLGDARELGELLPDNSVDVIFTDSPYPGEYTHLYGWLAEFGSRVLKPGGWLCAMTGKYHLDKIFALMSGKGLDYYWQVDLYTRGDSTPIMPRRVVTKSKPILMWTKGRSTIEVWNMIDVYKGQQKDKRFHRWGQDVGIGRYCLEYILGTGAKGFVVDPFVGGGATIEACQILGLNWLGFDNDPEAIKITRARAKNFIRPMFLLELEQLSLRDSDVKGVEYASK